MSEEAHKLAEDGLIFRSITGSHAYGMAIETSDEDYRGIFYLPKKLHSSPFFSLNSLEGFREDKDSTMYELTKFFTLLVDQNPNILELLWVDDRFIKETSVPYKFLRAHRDFLLSSKAMHTFSGYAFAQLKRIKGHNKWINNPQPKRRPKEIDYLSVIWNSTDNKEFNKNIPVSGYKAFHLGNDIYGLAYTGNTNHVLCDIHEALISYPVIEIEIHGIFIKNFSLIVKFNKQVYKEAVDNWKHYWEWKDNRNEKRSVLEEQYGYDTKHASHLIRLLRMGIEILKGEGIKVLRSDAQYLLNIRYGIYKYEELVEYAESLEAEMRSLYKDTSLSHSVDLEVASQILADTYEMCWV